MSPPRKPKKPKEPEGITKITVKGFKSLANETSIDIRPLTILAGANSSGKSSIMQPLLLLKQTLEVGYDPGALLLDGPNVRFTSADQLLTRVAGGAQSSELVVGIEVDGETAVTNVLSPAQDQSLALRQTTYSGPGLRAATFRSQPGVPQAATDRAGVRHGPFLVPRPEEGQSGDRLLAWGFAMLDRERFEERIRELIHLPGLRGNPERAYRTTATGPLFPGTFEPYAASIIKAWQEREPALVARLERHLGQLALARSIRATQVSGAQIELRVARLPRSRGGGPRDLVNIADVGFGVSQALPVVVALLAADFSGLVYVEQPELHLHPRAQVALAGILADAAKRGVRVVAETHSSLLLLGLRTLLAEGKLDPALVKLHWFERGSDGVTKVTSGDIDQTGAWDDWPEDFADVTLDAQARYLEAAEAKLLA